jgi:hypothetical protein
MRFTLKKQENTYPDWNKKSCKKYRKKCKILKNDLALFNKKAAEVFSRTAFQMRRGLLYKLLMPVKIDSRAASLIIPWPFISLAFSPFAAVSETIVISPVPPVSKTITVIMFPPVSESIMIPVARPLCLCRKHG